MVVNAILVVQAFFFGYLITVGALEIQDIELLPFMYSIFLFLIFASSVILVKEKSGQANKAANAEIAGNRVKYNPEVFAHLLFQGQKVNYTIQGKEILIGDRNAPLNLLMVANLNCYPCKLGFENVLKLIDQYPIQINATFRFLPSGSTVHDIPASTFLIQYWEQYIYGTNKESENTRKLIMDWYEEMSVEKFEKIYSNKLSIDEAKESKLAISHYEWIKKYEIVRTPTYFLNGYEYPSNYVIKDLGSLIFGVVSQLEEKNIVTNTTTELVL